MGMTRRSLPWRVIILTIIVIVIGLVVYFSFQNAFDLFRNFRVTINNESDYDIVSVKTGLEKGDHSKNNIEDGSLYILQRDVPSGKKVKFAPQLNLSGEGAIYLEFTDNQGKTQNHTVCGYTEYLSGNSYVTITNDKVSVVEECM
ncbi:hypothetical protein [Paenibacillus xylanilyticus]|uniref:hypothetical protein n=1 Tax=Paenibacillus xylanilyticus TaxID=248903 RepID=UPI00399F1307